MGNYSKMIGALVGGVAGLLVSVFGLPDAWTSPELQGAITIILSTVFAYAFPANTTE